MDPGRNVTARGRASPRRGITCTRVPVLASDIQEIEQQLVEILLAFLGEARDISRDTDLIADLHLESVQVMQFVVEVEDHYDIAIDLDTLSEARKLGDLAVIVAGARGA